MVKTLCHLAGALSPFFVWHAPYLILLTSAVATEVGEGRHPRFPSSHLAQVLVLLMVVGGIFLTVGKGFQGIREEQDHPLWYALCYGKQLRIL